MTMNKLSAKSDSEIQLKLTEAIAKEHQATAFLLAYLAEFDERKQYLTLGYSSLYNYLTGAHGYSEGAAARRITAARFARRHPTLFKMVSSGDLSLSVIGLIAKADLPLKDVDGVAKQLIRKSKSVAEILLARMGNAPKAVPVKEILKPVLVDMAPVCSTPPAAVPTSAGNRFDPPSAENSFAPPSAENSFDPPLAEPNADLCSEIAFKLSVQISQETRDALIRAQELLGATNFADTIDRVTAFFLAKKDPVVKAQRRIEPNEPAPPPPVAVEPPLLPSRPTRSRYIPAAVRHEVILRDGGCCSYTDPVTGKCCGERRYLEFDHRQPYALNGDHSVENIRLYCRGHNQKYAEQVYGKEFMARRSKTGNRQRCP